MNNRSQGQSLSSLLEIHAFFYEKELDKNIRINKRTRKVELWKNPINFDGLTSWFARKYGIEIPESKLKPVFLDFANENQYDPFFEYLQSLEEKAKQFTEQQSHDYFDNFCLQVLGIDTSIYVTYFKKQMIGTVARIYQPGCKHDDAVILHGSQGIGKSSFLREIAGQDYFSDELTGKLEDKDQKTLLSSKVILEWSEFDRQFGRDRSDVIKAALRRQVMNYRPPYLRDFNDYPLACTLWGTTNHQEFLPDHTGNRTFWVIPIEQKINCNMVKQERDFLWQHSINLYLRNYTHWLDTEELHIAHAQNVANYEISDPWEDDVKSYVDYRLNIDPQECFFPEHFLDKDCPQTGDSKFPILGNHEDIKFDRACQMRLAKIFTKLGLKKKRLDRVVDNIRVRKTIYRL